MNPLKIAVLYGGKSTEHEVSVHSAQTVCRTLLAQPERYTVYPIFIDKQHGHWFLQKACGPQTADDKPITPVLAEHTLMALDGSFHLDVDVFFPVLHGTNGEDGTMQGLLETLDVPYVGCNVLSSAMCMDKEVSKLLVSDTGVPTLPYCLISKNMPYDKEAIEAWASKQGLPVFVKPVRLGSSVGVRKVKTLSQLKPAIEFALQFDTDVMVEKGVDGAREVFCAVYTSQEETFVSACGELRNVAGEFFDYDAKYIVEGGCETTVPADIPPMTAAQMKADALKIYQRLHGNGLARVDFLMDKETGKYYFSEINTIPGLSETSLFPQLFEASGRPYAAILDELIGQAIQVHAEKKKLSFNR